MNIMSNYLQKTVELLLGKTYHKGSFAIILPYLLLLSFTTQQIDLFNPHKISVVNNSPYDGVAVFLVRPYGTQKPAMGNFTADLARIKSTCRKDVWPWVFFNRFYGCGERTMDPGAKVEYFQKIKGMDIYTSVA